MSFNSGYRGQRKWRDRRLLTCRLHLSWMTESFKTIGNGINNSVKRCRMQAFVSRVKGSLWQTFLWITKQVSDNTEYVLDTVVTEYKPAAHSSQAANEENDECQRYSQQDVHQCTPTFVWWKGTCCHRYSKHWYRSDGSLRDTNRVVSWLETSFKLPWSRLVASQSK